MGEPLDRAPPGRLSGFTLIEILAVIAILALLMSLAVPAISGAQERARVTACKQNLRSIAIELKGYSELDKGGKWPLQYSGIRFLLVLYKAKRISPKDSKVFLCPGTQDDNQGGQAYEDFDSIDPMTISYAGFDPKNGAGIRFDVNNPGEVVIAADDNDGRANHKHLTNIVYADATVDHFDITDYEAELGEQTFLPVGPDSPEPKLQGLSVE
ncbi:MAG: type II secretion system protein [Planctomycetota bacterium]